MMIASILIPSRGRFDGLLRTVRKFHENAEYKTQFEILVKLDDDDDGSLERICELEEAMPSVKVIIGPRMAGYFDLHRCYNALAAFSTGSWLWMFNDDAWVDSYAWDTEIAKRGQADRPICLYSRLEWDLDPGYHDYERCKRIYAEAKHYDFPIISRALYEAMGNYSMSYLNDVYVYDVVMQLPDAMRDLDGVTVKHTYVRDATHPSDLNVGEALKPEGRALIRRQAENAIKKIKAIYPQ